MLVLPYGMLFSENHFRLFRFGHRPWKGILIRKAWLLAVTLLSLAYQGNLKVGHSSSLPIPQTRQNINLSLIALSG